MSEPARHLAPDPAHGRAPSTFYLCLDVSACGLRFPVSAGDTFHGRCPRCGGEVQVVGVARDTTPHHATPTALAPSSLTPTPSFPASQIHLLLDNWRSLFNVGAAFRTADGAGVRHLYLCGITATPETQRKLAKTALGAERTVAWSYHRDAVRLAREVKDAGAALWVLENDPLSQSLFEIAPDALTQPVVLAAGNEKAGVDPGLLALADRVIHLPMVGHKESLNVAVAVSVAAYWLCAQEIAAHADQPARTLRRGDSV